MPTTSIKTLQTANKRICKFYEDNPSINFDAVNVLFVELFEKLLFDMSNTIDRTIHSQILATITDQSLQIGNIKSSIDSLQGTVGTMNTEIINTLFLKFFDLKRDYIEDVKSIIQNNTSDKIATLLEKNNDQLIDKTTLMMGDIVPKTHENLHKQINDIMKSFHKSIREETNVLSKITDTNSIKEFISNFEMKSSVLLQNVQQPIYTFISASEDRINSNITQLKDLASTNQSASTKVLSDLGEFLNKYRNSSYKGQFGENHLAGTLNKIFSTAEIINSSAQRASGDFIMKRDGKPTIMFENKEYDRNISPEEIKKFIRDIEEQGHHGVFLSQHTGITSKPNYHIETHNGNILVYVHNVKYSGEKIQIAVDIIDNLSSKLHNVGSNDKENNIPKEVLDEINREYQQFIEKKDIVINTIKESSRKILGQIDDIKLSSLDKYLSTKYASVQKQGFKCDLCKNFTVGTLKGLAAHKRGCNRKIIGNSTGLGNTSILPMKNQMINTLHDEKLVM
jgi:hypothetical protein